MMSIPRRSLALFLAVSLVAGTGLSSCTTGSLKVMHKARTGAIGFGSTGNHPDSRFWPHFGKDAPEVAAVHQAVRRGIEKALLNHPAFDYVPFEQMKEVPFHTSGGGHAFAVKKFAKVNRLDAVIRIWVIPDLRSQGVVISLLVNDSEGGLIAMSNANGHGAEGKLFKLKGLTDPAFLPGWEETAHDVMLKALSKVGG